MILRRAYLEQKWRGSVSSPLEIAHWSRTVVVHGTLRHGTSMHGGNWITEPGISYGKLPLHALTTSHVLSYTGGGHGVNRYTTGSLAVYLGLSRLTLISVFLVSRHNHL